MIGVHEDISSLFLFSSQCLLLDLCLSMNCKNPYAWFNSVLHLLIPTSNILRRIKSTLPERASTTFATTPARTCPRPKVVPPSTEIIGESFCQVINAELVLSGKVFIKFVLQEIVPLTIHAGCNLVDKTLRRNVDQLCPSKCLKTCCGAIAHSVERPSKVPGPGASLLTWVRFPSETIFSRELLCRSIGVRKNWR